MADSDLNIIKAVEALPSIQGLTPARQRQERRRREQPDEHSGSEPDEELANEAADEQASGSPDDPHSIDYCA